MFTLHIEAHSIAELKRKALAAFDAPAQAEMELPVKQAKPKAEKVKADVQPEPAAAAAVETEEVTITAVDCKEILKQVITAKGMDFATKFILGFGVKKVTDLPKSRYAEFMSEAKKELAE